MDAKPYRNRSVENSLPALHHRHKSMGNLLGNSQGAVAGFRGPAKRAAFGDVTNTVRNHGIVQDEIKAVRPRASIATLQKHNTLALDKENQPQLKDDRPLRFPRPSTSANDSKPFRLIEQAKSNILAVEEPMNELPLETQKEERAADEAAVDAIVHEPLPVKVTQLRRFKSQPYLKQQIKLRRTVSSQFDKTWSDCKTEGVATSLTRHEPSPVEDIDKPLSNQTEKASIIDERLDNLEKCNLNLKEEPTSLPYIPEEECRVSYPGEEQETFYPVPSEPEEYWEDDEEFFVDEEELNFTTAHSFRSKDTTARAGITGVLAPYQARAAQRELDEAREEMELTRLAEDRMMDSWDTSMAAEYSDEIFEYMQSLELSLMPNPDYMDAQTEIRWSMRSVLMDWLVQVHGRFNLLPETLFLTVNYIDRFLSNKVVSVGRLQLVGATAILVASKYEEIHSPCLSEIIYMVDGGYSMDELLKAERFMLNMLDFNLGWPGPMSFLRRVSKGDEYDVDTRTLAKYFIELTIMDERFVATRPSFLAAGAHCLSRFILNKGEWTKAHIYYSGYTWSQLTQLVTLIIGCCKNPQDHHAAIYEKYSSSRFKYAAVMVQTALDEGFTLPHQDAPVRRRNYRSHAL